ncbi:dentin sialophosphoprotein-like isoform X2 [Salvia splendens]|nr:dentin sialophosphoprotein-like isoform X2 [Salvia splendens]
MWVVLHIRDRRRCKEDREKEIEQKERESGVKMVKFVEEGKGEGNGKVRIKKAFSRVHSVRRRKAKEIEQGEDPYVPVKRNVGDVDAYEEYGDDEEYNLTDPNKDLVDKTALVEESPKEIHEVQVDFSPNILISNTIYHDPEVLRSLRLLKDEEDVREEAGKAMDMNIAEAKRLESLIARRRSKKVVSQRAKRSLMNNVATMGAQMPPIAIPKISSWGSPTRSIHPISPGPGSAPSMLGPTRNPFDLPYDPLEEKPNLTEDGFQQEFALGPNRDFMFCRHESFSLGTSLPMDFFEECDGASLIDDFGFKRRQSYVGYQCPRPETEDSDADLGTTTEAESGHESNSGPDSKSNLDILENDQIKEVIQVHENGSPEDCDDEPNTRSNALEELSLGEASTGSSNEDVTPVCRINREAILKSLSIRRNSVSVPNMENEHLQENNLSYANSALENASRLKQQYFADKLQRRHGMTFSIASDMQVEASELSSPPLTIGENTSYQEDNSSWDGMDSWAGSSRLSETEDNETRLPRANEAAPTRSKRADDEKAPGIPSSASASGLQATSLHSKTTAQTSSLESSSDENPSEEQSPAAAEDASVATTEMAASNEAGFETPAATGSNNHPTISPKSVLQPVPSAVSFEHEDHDEVQPSGTRPADHSSSNAPSDSWVQFTVGTSSNRGAESPQQNDHKLKQVVESGASDSEHAWLESDSSTSLSSEVESSDMDCMNVESKIQEILAFEAANSSNWANKGKMVIDESSHEQDDTSISSGDYDSELDERMYLPEGGGFK